ncbi:radical SAM/SPASM domain-containing protein [uncultured Intestinimonas sp.]|uniref:radical SAM/SPASM domain-containing protein n=1 Tax=uncultured Intestinimonas sp. TaxID=1689265 RepID=UPI0025CE222E|nr:radical SAM/SPASM domain-containing protein [uncultured Intestinimonas sp.]
MKAKVEGGYDHNRQKLADIVPLDAPFTVFIASTQICNFRCFYCTHSHKGEDNIHLHAVHMEDATFEAVVNQLQKFPKVGRILFTGLGEPLANPKIPSMIHRLKQVGVTDRIEIVTNASLLTHEMTDRLLDAGLTYLRVSLQGLSSEKYQEVAGVFLDFNKLVDNIRYFYEKKDDCKLYVKIMDACLESPEDEQIFYKIFGDISDQVYVEHIVKAQPQMLDQYSKNVTSERTFFNEPAEPRRICPFLFYTLQIDADGNVFPCPPLGFPESFSLGHVHSTTLHDIWFGEKLYDLQMLHLNGRRSQHPVCGNCQNYLCFTPEEDNLDLSADEIRKRLEARGHV